MHTKIFSATTVGIDSYLVEVEVDLSFGLLQFNIVGLPDLAIKESRQRIQAAIKNCGIKLPERKITVNLAPADLKKEGTVFDLPIAIGILHAAQILEIPSNFLQETIFIGELSLDGRIKPVKGVVAVAADAFKLGKKRIIVPKQNAKEASLIKGLDVIGINTLVELVAYIKGEIKIEPEIFEIQINENSELSLDFKDVKAQNAAKKACIISASGMHNILFIGTPGSGKTMLAERLCSIISPMSFNETLETTKIYSVSGKLSGDCLKTSRPFRAPHHTISQVGLVGGGTSPEPGEISLAHNGILFLDEFAEFKKSSIEGLRQPLESKSVMISRANYTTVFPANFLLVVALNPCPCGYFGDKRKACICNNKIIEKYLSKISGPMLDRIDIQVPVYSVDYSDIETSVTKLDSQSMKSFVERATKFRENRGQEVPNALLSASLIDKYCKLSPECKIIIQKAFDKLGLTMRGYHKLLKISRTIADLQESENIKVENIKEALMYRSLDQSLSSLSQN